MLKNLFSITLILIALTANVQAQMEDFGLEEKTELQSFNISEEQTPTTVEENVIIENKDDISSEEEEENDHKNNASTEEKTSADNDDVLSHEEKNKQQPEEEKLSYYIQHLNLSVEQQDKAKYIAGENQAKKEQLIRSLNVIRQQAQNLEDQSLLQFEALLTPEQKAQFLAMKKAYEAQNDQDSDNPVGEK